MKIAVTYDPANGMIGQHFGHSEFFKIYNVQGADIIGDVVVPTDGEGHGALAAFLNSMHIDMVICGGIGGGAKQALASLGIAIIAGVVGGTDAAVNAFLNNTLTGDPNFVCAHHGHGHDCGERDCGSCAHAQPHLPQ
ncbi:MAG: dinitrogenase iron-molybdenum cofactor biosynthesis protein [Oscillospiraceae bacterium]|nr:dinitrogenase iron-molybdenum cofactor biosynthesis protein [Oscillospiraceae bacterium]